MVIFACLVFNSKLYVVRLRHLSSILDKLELVVKTDVFQLCQRSERALLSEWDLLIFLCVSWEIRDFFTLSTSLNFSLEHSSLVFSDET